MKVGVDEANIGLHVLFARASMKAGIWWRAAEERALKFCRPFWVVPLLFGKAVRSSSSQGLGHSVIANNAADLGSHPRPMRTVCMSKLFEHLLQQGCFERARPFQFVAIRLGPSGLNECCKPAML